MRRADDDNTGRPRKDSPAPAQEPVHRGLKICPSASHVVVGLELERSQRLQANLQGMPLLLRAALDA